MIRNDTMTS